jgi:hypothetical protein
MGPVPVVLEINGKCLARRFSPGVLGFYDGFSWIYVDSIVLFRKFSPSE